MEALDEHLVIVVAEEHLVGRAELVYLVVTLAEIYQWMSLLAVERCSRLRGPGEEGPEELAELKSRHQIRAVFEPFQVKP